MAPRFAPGDDVEARDIDGKPVMIRLTRDMGTMIEGIITGFPPKPYEAGEPMIFPAAGARLIEAQPIGWQHPDGLVIFAGAL